MATKSQRVWQLANEFGITSRNAIFRLRDYGIDVPNHMTMLDGDQLKDARSILRDEPKEVPTDTRPWDADENPWSLDLLRTIKRREGFHPRWVREDRVEYYLQRGYKFAERQHYADMYDGLPGEETQLDSKLRRRELILMELPDDLYLKRQRHMREKTEMRSKTARDFAKGQAQRLGMDGFDVHLHESK